jgi:mono/diheme cytochrome c family protein
MYTLPALLVLALVTPHAVLADAQKGAQLAQQWCANCHIMGGTPAAAVPQGFVREIDRDLGLVGNRMQRHLSAPY